MATLNPLYPIAPWRLLPGMVCLDRDEFDTSGGGGGNDDDDEDDEDDEKDDADKSDKSKKSDDEDDDEDDDDDEKDLDEKAKGILRKNRKEARQAKARAKRAEEALEALKKGKGKSGDDEPDREKEAEARGAKRGMDMALKSSVRAELIAAGLNVGEDKSRAVKRAMRLIDFEDLSIDEDGDIDGLDDAISELKEEMPSLFAKAKKRRSNINGEDSRGGGKTPVKTASQRQAEALAKG